MKRLAHLAGHGRPTTGVRGVALLGSEHPLVRAAELLQNLSRQSLPVAAVLVGGLLAALEGNRWAIPLTIAAGWVLAVVGLVAIGLRQSKRRSAINLILAGREFLSIPDVQHQHQRLLSHRNRAALAQSFAEIVGLVVNPNLLTRNASPLFHVSVISPAVNEMREIIRLLQDDRGSARGIARAERLIEEATSALYGHSSDALRSELWLICTLLQA